MLLLLLLVVVVVMTMMTLCDDDGANGASSCKPYDADCCYYTQSHAARSVGSEHAPCQSG